ncbi:hypothetical protein KBC75_03925 [Candidatus Shapirobacteria bacterium]|nr:hypothetical protein [Candidatus Shapirobacteria bacterium]
MKNVLIVVTVIIIAIGGVFLWGRSESRGKVVVGQRAKITPIKKIENMTYDDDYLNWKYGSKFEMRKIETTDGRVLTNIELLGNVGLAVHYTITLREASQELADFSAVQFRRSRPDQYTEGIAEWGEKRGLLFTTEDNKEKTVFFREKDRILTVSMTVNSNDPELDKEFKTFWQGIEWKSW